MNVIITGCAGFIGSHACDVFLEKGYNVIGVDKLTYASNMENLQNALKSKNFNFIECDIRNEALIKHLCSARRVEWIINFAAESHVDNSIVGCDPFIESNLNGIVSLLEACKDLKVKLLHVSTDEVYGPADNNIEFDELSNLNPKNPYSASKASAEHFINAFANTFDVNYIIVRPSNNFGPRQHSEKFIPTIASKIFRKEKIPVYGLGLQSREWTYVKDTANAIEFILQNSKLNEIYNITSKKELENIQTIKNIFDFVPQNFTQDCIDIIEDRPGHDKRYCISNQKLSSIGWEDYSDYNQSLKATIDYYLKRSKF